MKAALTVAFSIVLVADAAAETVTENPDPNVRAIGSYSAQAESICRSTMEEMAEIDIDQTNGINSKLQADGIVSVWIDFTFVKSGRTDIYRCDIRGEEILRHDLAETWTQSIEMPFDMPM